jgi:hypothetical protein
MSGRAKILLVAVLLVALGWSCAKYPSTTPEEGDFATERMPSMESIPPGWGELISVSSCAKHGDWVQLWLQDEDGNLRLIGYNVTTNRFATTFRLIPRR